jgi:hypothetical protein
MMRRHHAGCRSHTALLAFTAYSGKHPRYFGPQDKETYASQKQAADCAQSPAITRPFAEPKGALSASTAVARLRHRLPFLEDVNRATCPQDRLAEPRFHFL